MADQYQALAKIYPGALIRNDLTYPVALAPFGASITTDDAEYPLDPALLSQGSDHLRAIQRERPGVHDGDVVRWLRTGSGHVIATQGSYFDMLTTCDAIRAEWAEHAEPADLDGLPLRARAHDAAGDPLLSGEGRCAAMGVTVIATLPPSVPSELGGPGEPGQQRTFVIGRRSASLATDPGVWHIAPSGTLEPVDGEDPVPVTVATELGEELGIYISVDDVRARIEVLGLAHDLLRLRPDLVVRLDLTESEAAQLDPPEGGEFTEFEMIPVDAVALAGFWRDYPPERITPPAAGAIALLGESFRRAAQAAGAGR